MEVFNHLNICSADKNTGYKQFRLPECAGDNFLMKMLDRLTKGAAPLSMLIKNKVELVGDKGSPASVTMR